jgi:hypothetical protein
MRFGVVRGLSSADAYSRYALLYFRSRFPEGTVWRPDPLDERACLAEVRREGKPGDWVLRYSWRQPEPVLADAEGPGHGARASTGHGPQGRPEESSPA